MSHFGYQVQYGSDQELLDLTRDAIAKITAGGQAYTSDGRSLTRADLGALWAQVRELEKRLAPAGSTYNHARLVRR
jgi:hypothetical protein